MGREYYRILGVSENATETEIRKKYRELARKYHPDSNPGDIEAEKRFREIAEAYAVLSDKEKRSAYDARRLPKEKEKSVSPMEQFFGFRPDMKNTYGKTSNFKKEQKANPIDMTEMFERYMGIKR